MRPRQHPHLGGDVYFATCRDPRPRRADHRGESAFAAGTDLPVAISTRTHPKGRFGWADVLIEFELVAALAVVFGCLASERLTPLSAGR